jgi:predicted DNA-binding transcriptional regulator AlpA
MDASHRKRLRAKEAAAYLEINRSTLAKWRMKGEGPPYHRCGPRIVFYQREEIDDWLRECDERRPTKARGSAES